MAVLVLVLVLVLALAVQLLDGGLDAGNPGAEKNGSGHTQFHQGLAALCPTLAALGRGGPVGSAVVGGVRGCATLRRVRGMPVGLVLSGVGLAVVAAGAGCTSSAGKKAGGNEPAAGPSAVVSAPPFVEPAAYSYVLTRGCDAGKPLARYRATVRDGAVVRSERLDAAVHPPNDPPVDLGPVGGEDGEEIEVPTLGELLQIADTASEDGGEVTTTFDAQDGHPVKVVVNVSEAECFTVSEYVP